MPSTVGCRNKSFIVDGGVQEKDNGEREDEIRSCGFRVSEISREILRTLTEVVRPILYFEQDATKLQHAHNGPKEIETEVARSTIRAYVAREM